MKKQTNNSRLDIRLPLFVKNRIKMDSGFYADGNMTEWIVYCCSSAPRKFIVKNDLYEWLSKNKKAPAHARAKKKK